MRGAVTAGMCVALERAGLLPAFDRVIGCSSGALAGCYAAAGQAERWARSFEDAACRAFIDPRRALRRRPVLDLDYLFETVCRSRRPLSAAGLARGPQLSTVAVTADTGELRVLSGLADPAEALAAVRASCTIPLVAGGPTVFRGEPLVDGGLLEPIPFRTRAAGGRDARARAALALRPLARGRAPHAGRARARPRPSGARAAARRLPRALQRRRRALADGGDPRLLQVAPPAGARLVGRFSTDAPRIAHSVALGAACMARLLARRPGARTRTWARAAASRPAGPGGRHAVIRRGLACAGWSTRSTWSGG